MLHTFTTALETHTCTHTHAFVIAAGASLAVNHERKGSSSSPLAAEYVWRSFDTLDSIWQSDVAPPGVPEN